MVVLSKLNPEVGTLLQSYDSYGVLTIGGGLTRRPLSNSSNWYLPELGSHFGIRQHWVP